jgi:hypothetical protein
MHALPGVYDFLQVSGVCSRMTLCEEREKENNAKQLGVFSSLAPLASFIICRSHLA